MTEPFVAGLLRRIGDALFRADDELAQRQDWQVHIGRFGLSRTYRHPGFDRLTRCPDCRGAGRRFDADCDRCSGTGRVTLGQSSPAGRR